VTRGRFIAPRVELKETLSPVFQKPAVARHRVCAGHGPAACPEASYRLRIRRVRIDPLQVAVFGARVARALYVGAFPFGGCVRSPPNRLLSGVTLRHARFVFSRRPLEAGRYAILETQSDPAASPELISGLVWRRARGDSESCGWGGAGGAGGRIGLAQLKRSDQTPLPNRRPLTRCGHLPASGGPMW